MNSYSHKWRNTQQQYSAIQIPDNKRKKIIYQHRNQSYQSIHITGGQSGNVRQSVCYSSAGKRQRYKADSKRHFEEIKCPVRKNVCRTDRHPLYKG